MARLAIRKVRYDGANYTFETPLLKDGLNILVGPNGSGKSTFSSLIYYCLGGEVDSFRTDKSNQHKEITSDRNNFVELSIEIDGQPFVINRYLRSNDIAIRNGEHIEVFPVHRLKDSKAIFSDWLLEKLGISAIQLQFGTISWQINFRDLMRLMYHDQAMDPSDVYKAADGEGNFVLDSKVMKKAIFEMLVDKGFQDYYAALAHFRDLERQRSQVSGSLEVFKDAMAEIQRGREDLNVIFIDQRLSDSRSRLEKLLAHRRVLATPAASLQHTEGLSVWKGELLALELRQADLLGTENNLLAEIDRLQKIRSSLVLEATQIRKMVFAHEQLNLFSANTCPYCLREVVRTPHRCVCGTAVEEKDYEHFFYEASEYLTILKTKQRNVETVDLAIATCDSERTKSQNQRAVLLARGQEIRMLISKQIGDLGLTLDLSQFDQIDTTIMEIRAEMAALEQQRELEGKRERLETKLGQLKTEMEIARRQAGQLERQAEAEMVNRRKAFSEKYNELMRHTVKDCRQAAIDLDYMPLINAGEYKEASSNVPRRLMYYATLLFLSKSDKTVPFPRFLLIDTPDTAGIDQQNLINALAKVSEVVQASGASCQVILTTGEGKYPVQNEGDVFLRLSNTDRLLKPKPPAM